MAHSCPTKAGKKASLLSDDRPDLGWQTNFLTLITFEQIYVACDAVLYNAETETCFKIIFYICACV